MKLENVLARHLRVGELFDELSGVKGMSAEDLQAALDAFCKDAETVVRREWQRLRELPPARHDPARLAAHS